MKKIVLKNVVDSKGIYFFCALIWASACNVAAATASSDTATRCGWFDNPSPSNVTLVDKDGEWTIGMQGGHQAKGPWPAFPKARWVATGTGSAGYGCACLKFSARAGTQEVTQIFSARSLPLETCRRDKALAGTEPENPLK
ncbi:DUF4087 domain-containing protein [Acidovorax sp. NCPPB 4044]|uniref:DUF4087 domain-containing protein n=1 Tax=Acidovorax sp. NCPPB 4044 TaxID=2940490 RepID=UPI0023043FB9|nr:DUF4087 domain-containing protein [Acidovorax sp. NCPPB 4044]MDA8522730.1 DUF4087 domain-containing protein [Acidovorax sp. NCPPB 4044]